MFFSIVKDLIFLVSFISLNNSFPQPLSLEEENYHIRRLQQGDEDSRIILIERNLRLVAHIVKKYNNIGKEMDDLISIGTIGLIKAITTYDVSKGTRLATYASRCIENEILMSIRSEKKNRGEVYLQEPIGIDKEGNEISLMDILQSNSDSVIDKVELNIQLKKLKQVMKAVLKNREKKVLELRYGLLNGVRRTQKEIAKKLGISRSYVSRIEKKAIKKLSQELQSNSQKY